MNPAASKPLTTIHRAPTSAQTSEQRELEDNIPKHLPFSLKFSTQKEKLFRDLENEKWVRDLEMEIKNTGDKPIYFIQFALLPDFGKAPGDRSLGLTIQYGRDELAPFETATAEDVPVKPGETGLMRVREMEVQGWDWIKKKEHWPEQWSRPKKVSLYFQELHFGDGTGFLNGGGEPHKRSTN